MKKLFLLIILLFLSASAASADISHATIEVKGGAVFVTAEDVTVNEIKQWADTEVNRGESDFAAVAKALSERFGDKITIESFATQEFAAAAGVKEVSLPLRDAILSGKVPPVEGLSLDEAMIVLAAFGFNAVPAIDFNLFTEDRKFSAMLEAETALVVFDGTGPFDEIKVYYKLETEKKH